MISTFTQGTSRPLHAGKVAAGAGLIATMALLSVALQATVHASLGAFGVAVAAAALSTLLLAIIFVLLACATLLGNLRREHLIASAIVFATVLFGTQLVQVMAYSTLHGCG